MFLISGCGGGGTTKPTVASVVISAFQNSLSVGKGQILQVSAQTLDVNGSTTTSISGITYTIIPGSTPQTPSAVATISVNGLICGGTWDSVAAPVVCNLIPDPNGVGTMTLTATADGVTSAPITVYVHKPVLHFNASLVAPSVAPPNGCFSQGTDVTYQAVALDASNNDITSTIGPITFGTTSSLVAAIDSTITPAPPPTQQIFKTNIPGLTQIFPTVSGTNGSATPLYTCSPASIAITPAGPVSLSSAGSTQALTLTAVDVNGATINNLPVTYLTSYSAVASVTATTSSGVTTQNFTAGSSPGTTYISAVCAPPNCDINEDKPIFSNLVQVNVTVSATTPKIYVASSATPTSGVTNLIPIDSSNNTAGTAVAFASGQIPNAMTFGHNSPGLWISTNTGLANFDPNTKAFATTATNITGKILAIANNGSALIVNDTTIGAVFYVNASNNAATQFNIPGVTAAAFTPDGGTVYLASGSTLYAYTPAYAGTPIQVPLTGSATDVSVLQNGQLFYLAETTQFDARATCDRTSFSTTGGAPDHVLSLPNGTQMIATDGINIWGIAPTWTPSADAVCAPAVTAITPGWNSYAAPAAYTAQQIIVTPDSKHVYITNNTNNLIAYDPATNTVSTIAIGAQTFTGASTLDSSKVYVGAADGKVHVITTSSNTDTAQIAITGLCTGPCLPDLVAVQPK